MDQGRQERRCLRHDGRELAHSGWLTADEDS